MTACLVLHDLGENICSVIRLVLRQAGVRGCQLNGPYNSLETVKLRFRYPLEVLNINPNGVRKEATFEQLNLETHVRDGCTAVGQYDNTCS